MKKNVKYFEILSGEDLNKALSIAKKNLSIVAVEDEIDSLNFDSDYDDFEELERDTDRDNYLSAEEALCYGIIDKILIDRKGE